MHFPLSFCKNASPYFFFHGAFAPSFIWSRRPCIREGDVRVLAMVKVVLCGGGGGSPDEARLEQTPYHILFPHYIISSLAC